MSDRALVSALPMTGALAISGALAGGWFFEGWDALALGVVLGGVAGFMLDKIRHHKLSNKA
ncbi:MAG: hypothetical protein MI920_00365 [Kiloniellales bacterium]|nr:hypothetical protein [Kiloniellales bacterium]